MHYFLWFIVLVIWKHVVCSILNRYFQYKWEKNCPIDAKIHFLFSEALQLHNRSYFRNAMSWYENIFVKYNHAPSACNIGCILARDNNFKGAREWFLKANEAGDLVTAQYNLGLISEKEGDLIEAQYWYSRASVKDYALAKARLTHVQLLRKKMQEEEKGNLAELQKLTEKMS